MLDRARLRACRSTHAVKCACKCEYIRINFCYVWRRKAPWWQSHGRSRLATPPHIWTCEMFKSITALANAAQPISKVEMKVLCSTGHGPSLIASSLGHGPSPALASLCVDGFLAFRGQLSKPQINLKMNDEPEPKPPAINIFSILVRPNVPTLVPVVVKSRMCDLRTAHHGARACLVLELETATLIRPLE